MQTILCMKWGTRYGPEFVNRLYSSICRNTKRKTRLVCFTDDASGIVDQVQIEQIPQINLPAHLVNLPWRKLVMWKYPLGKLEGDALFLDLDLVITGNLDEMFDFEPGRFCVIENWTQMGQGIGNTSAFKFPIGKYKHIFDRFQADPDRFLQQYNIEQVYISKEIEDMVFWPQSWCVSFKHSLKPRWPLNFFQTTPLPPATKIVAFTGKPDPDDALIGKWPEKRWYKKIYKYVRPVPWIAEHWR